MTIHDYYHQVLLPSNVAVSAMRRAGLYIDEQRAKAQMEAWQQELRVLEQTVEAAAARKGFPFQYSPRHSPCPDQMVRDFLFKGLALKIVRRTKPESGVSKPSIDDEALLPYAAVGANHRATDNPVVYALLKIRSIAKARGTHLGGLLAARRADGAAHAKFNWNLRNTTRLSAEDPPVHQLPEKADPEVAQLVKRCIVPRVGAWLGDPAEWDPRKHGWCAKVDVKGAEMVIRAGCIARDRVLGPYLREGRDSHGKTASVFYGKPDGTYKKSAPERNVVGKQSNFLLIFGGSWRALQQTLWTLGRMKLPDAVVQRGHAAFFQSYPDLARQYETDTGTMVQHGYIEDDYGRRWHMPMPEGFSAQEVNGKWEFLYQGNPRPGNTSLDDRLKAQWRLLEYRRHCHANRRTQCDQGTTTLWCLALCHHGEYVELRVPPYWERYGVPFPEAAQWQLNEGEGPGGKPFRVWITNTVHDSGWFDGAPGTLEPAMMTIMRRFMGVPADFLYEADQPWRVEMEVGPTLGDLLPYNQVAKQFGLAEAPEW